MPHEIITSFISVFLPLKWKWQISKATYFADWCVRPSAFSISANLMILSSSMFSHCTNSDVGTPSRCASGYSVAYHFMNSSRFLEALCVPQSQSIAISLTVSFWCPSTACFSIFVLIVLTPFYAHVLLVIGLNRCTVNLLLTSDQKN